MTQKIAPTSGLVLAIALCGVVGGAPPVHAQERTLTPTNEKVCAECGAVRDKGEVCPFCGAKEVTKPGAPAAPRTPAPVPGKPADELPAPTAPGPRDAGKPGAPA